MNKLSIVTSFIFGFICCLSWMRWNVGNKIDSKLKEVNERMETIKQLRAKMELLIDKLQRTQEELRQIKKEAKQ